MPRVARGVLAVLLVARAVAFYQQPAAVELGGGVAWVWALACLAAAVVVAAL